MTAQSMPLSQNSLHGHKPNTTLAQHWNVVLRVTETLGGWLVELPEHFSQRYVDAATGIGLVQIDRVGARVQETEHDLLLRLTARGHEALPGASPWLLGMRQRHEIRLSLRVSAAFTAEVPLEVERGWQRSL